MRFSLASFISATALLATAQALPADISPNQLAARHDDAHFLPLWKGLTTVVPGDGFLISFVVPSDFQACVELCRSNKQCQYFNHYRTPTDGRCALFRRIYTEIETVAIPGVTNSVGFMKMPRDGCASIM
ncbi:hypothetical protein TWF694_008922 [Orbilia ellipsospora]|uniref:Apple domain-containing protein n=1 Tax=Orbilia ellipsospora TaxID=2528407 RepID=A0AAV9XDF1_9PEZI